jgi:RNA polymerase sigma factor (sigma-70 family)
MDKENQFKAVLQGNSDRIYRICCCYVRDENARQDVFQTVLMHIWESLETFKGGSQISTWVFRVTVNTCLGHLRAQRREQRILADVAEQAQLAGVPISPPPTETCGTRDDVERLYDCIHQLPDAHFPLSRGGGHGGDGGRVGDLARQCPGKGAPGQEGIETDVGKGQRWTGMI